MPTYLCFVDYTKAFDNVQWSRLWKVLNTMGAPAHLIGVVKSLYETSLAKIKLDNNLSDKCTINKGVRQRYIISPLLFNIYSEHVMRIVLDHLQGCVNIGMKLSNLCCADVNS